MYANFSVSVIAEPDAVTGFPSAVSASLLVILISATCESLTSASAVSLTSPKVAVKVYLPAVKLAVASNTTVTPSVVNLPSTLALPFVTSNVTPSGTAESKVAVNCAAFVAFNSVILPRVVGAVLGASDGAVLGASVGASLGAVLGASVGFVSSFVTVTATVACQGAGRRLKTQGIFYFFG